MVTKINLHILEQMLVTLAQTHKTLMKSDNPSPQLQSCIFSYLCSHF